MLRHLLPRLDLSVFFQLPLNVKLACALPLFLFRIYISLLGLFYFAVKHKERKRIIVAIHYVFNTWFDRSKSMLTTLKAFQGLFDHYYEKLVMAHRPMPKLIDYLASRLEVNNERFLEQAVACGRGAIVVTGHFGAVEFLPLAMALRGFKIAMIVRFRTQLLKERLMSQADEVDVLLIDAEGPNVAFNALKALKNGRILITECDEFKHWRQGSHKHVSVFGNAVPMDNTLDFFYRRVGLPAFLALMRRNENSTYTLCLEPLAKGERNVTLGERAWEELEKYIMNYPEQWYQWKDAVPELSAFIDWENFDGDTQNIYLSAERPLYSADIS